MSRPRRISDPINKLASSSGNDTVPNHADDVSALDAGPP